MNLIHLPHLAFAFLFTTTIACQPRGELKRGVIDSTHTESKTLAKLELIAGIDSLQYPSGFIAAGDKLYITGYTFTGGNTRYSMIVCVDTRNKNIAWSRTIYTHPSVELRNLSIIDNKLYVTGFAGVSGVVKDSLDRKIADPIDLNPVIISMNTDGTGYHYQEIEGDNPHYIGSAVVKHHNRFYMTYGYLNATDWSTISRTGTKIVELSKQLKVLRSQEFFPGIVTRQQLNSFGGKLFLTGLHGTGDHQLKGFEFDDNLTQEVKHYALDTENYEFNYTCIPQDDGLHLLSVGRNRNRDQAGDIFREFMLTRNGWVKGRQCQLNVNINDDDLAIYNGKTIAFGSRDAEPERRYSRLVAIDGIGLTELVRFNSEDYPVLYVSGLLIDSKGVPYLATNNNDRTRIYALPEIP